MLPGNVNPLRLKLWDLSSDKFSDPETDPHIQDIIEVFYESERPPGLVGYQLKLK